MGMVDAQATSPEPNKWESRKLWLVVGAVLVTGVLAYTKTVTAEQYLDVIKWLVSGYLGANALIGGIASLKK